MVSTDATKDAVVALIEQPLRQQGFEIAEVVLSRYKRSALLRVFVYGENGVSLDECARLSTLIGDLIEPTELFSGGYTLEVSSPGLERPLKTARDFHYRIGEKVQVRFTDPARKPLQTEIRNATETAVEFVQEDGTVWIPLEEIEMAKIVF